MNPVTKSDLQVGLQQATNTIITKTASYQDIQTMIQGMGQRLCTKQDLQTTVNGVRDSVVDKMSAVVREQQTAMRTLLVQIDALQRRMMQLEAKIDGVKLGVGAMHGTVQQLSTNNHQHDAEPAKQPIFEEYFAQQRFAQNS